jgi:hypothetical protein
MKIAANSLLSIYYIVVLVFLMLSCEEEKKIHFEEATMGELYLMEETFISIPLEMVMFKNYILISDFNGDSLIHIFDKRMNKIIKKSAFKGEGPQDFLSPLQMVPFNDSVIFINCRWHYMMGNYKLNNSLDFIENGRRYYSISTDVDMIFPLDEKRYIASGRFEKGRYALLDSTGKIQEFFGEYPNYMEGENKISNFPKFMFHQSIFTTNKSKTLLASVTSHTLDIMNYSQHIPLLEKSIYLSEYKYNFEEGDQWARSLKDRKTENGVRRIYSTDSYIYLLYDPNKDDNKKKNTEIWIFNWTGNPIKKIILDDFVYTFCVDSQDNNLYGIANVPEPSLCTINLKN